MSSKGIDCYDLSDAQWALIDVLFPKQRRCKGRPWRDHRTILNGMFWILRSGASWRALPERYGPWQTVYDRFARYQNDGTLDRILERLHFKLDAEGLRMADSTTTRQVSNEKLRHVYKSPLLYTLMIQDVLVADGAARNGEPA